MTVVTVYTLPACPGCVMTKRHLDKIGVPYTEVALDSEPGIRDAARELGLLSAPIVCANVDGEERFWEGFRPDSLDALAVTA